MSSAWPRSRGFRDVPTDCWLRNPEAVADTGQAEGSTLEGVEARCT
jgi:hypothetical protein